MIISNLDPQQRALSRFLTSLCILCSAGEPIDMLFWVNYTSRVKSRGRRPCDIYVKYTRSGAVLPLKGGNPRCLLLDGIRSWRGGKFFRIDGWKLKKSVDAVTALPAQQGSSSQPITKQY